MRRGIVIASDERVFEAVREQTPLLELERGEVRLHEVASPYERDLHPPLQPRT